VNLTVVSYIDRAQAVRTCERKYAIVAELFRYLVSPEAAGLRPECRAVCLEYADEVRAHVRDLAVSAGMSRPGVAAILSALSEFERGVVRRQSSRQRDIRLARAECGRVPVPACSWEGRELLSC
jgi:hypothetical protein